MMTITMKCLAGSMLLAATTAFAHHGWSEYDSAETLKVTGIIEESGYSHPHGYVRLKGEDKTWMVVLAPPSRMENRGLSKEMLNPGNRATVVGYPNRNKPEEMRAERIVIGDKSTELR
jgi:hypothetical protein